MSGKYNEITVDTSKLKRLSNGFIDWVGSVGSVLSYHIENTEHTGYITVCETIRPNKVSIKVDDNDPIVVIRDRLLNNDLKKCFGINAVKFAYDVGEVITTSKHSVVILGRELRRNYRHYRVKCLEDNYEYDISESNLKEAIKRDNTRCPVCDNTIIIDGINSLYDVSPDLAEWFADKDIPHKIPRYSNKEYDFLCPFCGTVFRSRPQSIKSIPHCPKCDDGISFPEKVFANILNQIGVEYIYQLSKKHFDWCNNYRYDFYFIDGNKQYIVELDGGLGHGKKEIKPGGIERDRAKEMLASENGIDIFRIDVDYNSIATRFEYIKNKICESALAILFDLTCINWNSVRLLSEKSLLQTCCNEYNSGNTYILSISEKCGISKDSVRKYLKIGAELNICDYDSTSGWKNYMNKYFDSSKCRKFLKIVHGEDFIVCNGISDSPVAIKEMWGITITKETIFRNLSNPSIKSRKGLSFSYATEQEYLDCLRISA